MTFPHRCTLFDLDSFVSFDRRKIRKRSWRRRGGFIMSTSNVPKMSHLCGCLRAIFSAARQESRPDDMVACAQMRALHRAK